MKNIFKLFIISFLAATIFSACTKDVVTDKFTKMPAKAISMQVLDQEPVISGDTAYFSILASDPESKIVKFSVEHQSEFEGYMSLVTTQVADSVQVNDKGELSKPVNTILINYPVKGTKKAGDILTAKFTFTDQAGKTFSVSASKIVVNYRTNAKQEFLYASRPFYNFYTGKAYSRTVLNNNDTFRDSLDVFWIRENGIQYLCSPNSDKTAEYFSNVPSVNYVQSEMRATKFIKLDGLTLNDVDDKVLENMDFTNGVDVIVLEHNAVYGVLLQDGRKAALETQIYSTVYSRVRSKYQIN